MGYPKFLTGVFTDQAAAGVPAAGAAAGGSTSSLAAAAGSAGNILGGQGVSASARHKNPAIGIFGEFPGVTPKYAYNAGLRGDNYRETMARMFVTMGQTQLKVYLAAVANTPTAPLARVLAGTGTSGGNGYIDFILTAAQHSMTEKVERTEFLSDDFVVYYYGQSAPIFNYSGYLMNTYQDDQVNNMFRIYRDLIRGTALARSKQALRLKYSGFIVSGFVDALNFSLASDNENVCVFNFAMTVKQLDLVPNTKYVLAPLSSPTDGMSLAAAGDVTGTVNTRTTMDTVPGSAAAAPPPSAPPASATPVPTTEADAAILNTMVNNANGFNNFRGGILPPR